ncbi:MAG: T9SS type A sorting domain-containing protein [Bacteroidota bacterium]
MRQKQLILSLLVLAGFPLMTRAQQLPGFGIPAGDTVFVHSGSNQLFLPNLSDGDDGTQPLTIGVVSSDESLLAVDSVIHATGDQMAIVWVTEQGKTGSVTLTATVTDPDGSFVGDWELVVSAYMHHGINFEIHDAIFWQEVVPLNDVPAYGSVVQTTNMGFVYGRLNWSSIPLAVSAECGTYWQCDGHDFATGFLEGFIVPGKTGSYHFYMSGAADYALFLSTDSHFKNATVIAASSDNHSDVGEAVNGRKSAAIALDSGRVYAMYAAQWNVHEETGGVKWELPGVSDATYIDGSCLYPEWDTRRPDPLDDLEATITGDRFLRISWGTGSDDQKLAGYHVYLNGVKMNTAAVTGNSYLLEGLTAGTDYSIAVTAIDRVRNESHVENILHVQTLERDSIPPAPPDSLLVEEATGLAVQVSWEGAADGQSSVIGYRLYLDGALYSGEEIIQTNSAVLQVLAPGTTYSLEIESVDAGMNVSEKSQVFAFSTTAFDPLDNNLGLRTGRLEVSPVAMSYNEGIGINPDFISGEVFNAAHTRLLEDLQPGAIRWGALTANPLSFKNYAGAGKKVTIAKFMDRCNQLSAYTAFCCGVENRTDWRTNPETFERFLEYINGPGDTPGGRLRVAEGFTEPLLPDSPGLIFEFGNEVWGSSAHDAQIGSNYVTYANWCREMARVMKASPWYDSTKIVLAYSSRYPSREDSYGLNDKIIAGDRGEVEWTAPSGYLGGNLNYDPEFPPADSELEYYQNVRNRADRYLEGMVASHKFEVQETGRLMEQYMYESNTTTPTYNGRLGQALVSTDYYLSAMERGSAIPTIFHLTGGEWRITEPENNYRGLPLFLTASYFNRLCKGDVLRNTYHSNRGGSSLQGATFSERPVGAHAYRNEQGYSVVLISRDYENDHYVEIDLPDSLVCSETGQLFLITGPGFSTKQATVDTLEVAIRDSMIVQVPKHAMVLLHFQAEGIVMTKLPLAWYPYPRIAGIEIPEGNYHFTKTSESKRFNAAISPSNSWDREVEWTLRYNSGNYGLLGYETYCLVYVSSDLSNETDSLILRASSRAGDVSGEVVLYPTNPEVGKEVAWAEPGLRMYPNPAGASFRIESSDEATLRLYNVNGIKIHEEEIGKGTNIINTAYLPGGIYAVQVGRMMGRLVIYSK